MDAYQKTRDCLDDLDLRPGASWEDVKAAYHTLVQVWHPDRFAAGTAIQFKAEERFKEAKAAYEWLEDHRLLLEDLAAGRWRPDPGPPKPPEPSDEVELDRDKPWYRRRYSGPIYAARRWMPRVQVPWLFVAALLAAVIIVATNREPEVEPFVFPQVAEAIGSPTPESLWVYDQRLDLRSLPGVESPPAGSLERGERVRVIERRDGWRRVARLDSDEPLGWVQAWQIGPREPPMPDGEGDDDAVAQRPPAPPPTIRERVAERTPIAPIYTRETPVAEPSDAATREPTWRVIGSWSRTQAFVTEPFEVPAGPWRLTLTSHEIGAVDIELFSIERDRVVATTSRRSPGSSTLSFERAGDYLITVTASGVSWEAIVESSS